MPEQRVNTVKADLHLIMVVGQLSAHPVAGEGLRA
jgi:hypothetical protein